MKIIADSGSTKCTWLVTDGVHTSEYRTRGINAVQHSPEQIREALAELPPCGPVEAVYFYGAGCGGTFPEATEKMVRELRAHFGTGRIEAETDLLGAARALFGNRPGIACILGTGSNCGVYDGREITLNTPPMGYILGDEGSGAVLGRKLINVIFKHPGLLPYDIIEDFNLTYNLSKGNIIERVYRQPAANRFLASFCPFIKKHITHPVIHNLVATSFEEFLSANLPADLLQSPTLPIGFVGSIAYHFSDILTAVCTRHGLTCASILSAPLPALISQI
mgnify:CR=1 FL=1